MNIHTVQFSRILEASSIEKLDYFLSRTAFVISHKNESIDTLLAVLGYLPANSPVIIVSNCHENQRVEIERTLSNHFARHTRTYFVHQKDEAIARTFQEYGVHHILGADGKVVDGKGEGMYIGTLGAYQLGYPEWIIFYDADNYLPSALLEYTLAMCRLFLSASFPTLVDESETSSASERAEPGQTGPGLHIVRVCWSSKPELGSGRWETGILGRCTRVVSPLFTHLVEEWFGMRNYAISSSNAGEQGMTLKTATSLRFSSGFSVETFHLLDLLSHAAEPKRSARSILFQQYLSKSPHFHEKKGGEHIKKMIEESLGGFAHFETILPDKVKRQLYKVYHDLHLDFVSPVAYPPLHDLPLERDKSLMDRYKLLRDVDYEDMLVAE